MIYKEYFIDLHNENEKHYKNNQLVRIMTKTVKK